MWHPVCCMNMTYFLLQCLFIVKIHWYAHVTPTTSMKENNPSNVIYIHHKAPVIETLKPHQDTASHALFDLKTWIEMRLVKWLRDKIHWSPIFCNFSSSPTHTHFRITILLSDSSVCVCLCVCNVCVRVRACVWKRWLSISQDPKQTVLSALLIFQHSYILVIHV